jgi:hypothetical protein
MARTIFYTSLGKNTPIWANNNKIKSSSLDYKLLKHDHNKKMKCQSTKGEVQFLFTLICVGYHGKLCCCS